MSKPPRVTRRELVAAGLSAGAAIMVPRLVQASPMDSPSSKFEIVDPHVHVWKNDPRYPWPVELKNPPAEDALPETLLALMRDHGVARTVIVHVIYYRWDCRYAGDVVRAHPDKFQGVCRVDPTAKTAADDVARWVREYGFRGVRLSPSNGPDGDWINDRAQMDSIFNRAAELRVPLCILAPVERMPDVGKVLERHRDAVDVTIDHMADCPIDEPKKLEDLLALARLPRVSVKLSHLWSLSKEPYPYRDTHGQVRRLYDAFGPQRLMWGTDWPAVESYCGYAKALALYRDEISFFTDEDRRWILGGTAGKLWPA